MKRIIDGRKYDTETANCVGCAGYSSPGDFHWWAESLYQKKNGEFFLHGEGGPMSMYSRETGQNEWSSGEKITPICESEARIWAELYLSGDEYEAIFGEIEE